MKPTWMHAALKSAFPLWLTTRSRYARCTKPGSQSDQLLVASHAPSFGSIGLRYETRVGPTLRERLVFGIVRFGDTDRGQSGRNACGQTCSTMLLGPCQKTFVFFTRPTQQRHCHIFCCG